jgi:hypothetical protein
MKCVYRDGLLSEETVKLFISFILSHLQTIALIAHLDFLSEGRLSILAKNSLYFGEGNPIFFSKSYLPARILDAVNYYLIWSPTILALLYASGLFAPYYSYDVID